MNNIARQLDLLTLNGRDITYCKADGSYTEVNFSDNRSILLSYRISIIQNNLNSDNFIQLSQILSCKQEKH
jgi:hypothetical protein